MVKEEQVELEKYCHYSDLPSPMVYVNDMTDYDGMGNYGRFPEPRRKEKSFMKRLIQKIVLLFRFNKKKSKRKSIWEL